MQVVEIKGLVLHAGKSAMTGCEVMAMSGTCGSRGRTCATCVSEFHVNCAQMYYETQPVVLLGP
jgi:hypothetical protein